MNNLNSETIQKVLILATHVHLLRRLFLHLFAILKLRKGLKASPIFFLPKFISNRNLYNTRLSLLAVLSILEILKVLLFLKCEAQSVTDTYFKCTYEVTAFYQT
jgi:hypothetical protein